MKNMKHLQESIDNKRTIDKSASYFVGLFLAKMERDSGKWFHSND